MTTKSPTLQPFPCSNPTCSNTVAPRRKSSTGDHWCPSSDCQAMKQRQRRAAAKLSQSFGSTQAEERLALLRLALHGDRVPCPKCDLRNAIPGFLHRAAPQSKVICDGVGGAGRAAGPLWIDAVHPDRAER